MVGDTVLDANWVLFIGRHTLETAFLVAAPILIVCIIVGLLVSLFQAVTSLKDMTLSMVPKLFAVGITAVIFGGWMLEVVLRFTNEIFSYIQNYGS
ncbi:MAG: flagellar biosynthetic protein FliQ [Planctomycetes bacterium]|nr:flagellar biosynthetic protein FliQ [Planctomycetota bacterium]